MEKRKILWKLFFSTFYLSMFTFGGGYVIITLLKNKFVDELQWIEEEEMLDMVAIAQSSPGPIAVNGAIVIGYKLSGIIGAAVAVLGAILPPFLILSLVSGIYNLMRDNQVVSSMLLGMQSGVGAVIVSVVYDMMTAELHKKKTSSIIIMMGAFIANYVFGLSAVVIILVCALYGVYTTIKGERKEQNR